MPKIEPAVTQLFYNFPDGTSYIDIAKDLSIVNRRLYRSGMVYAIQDIQLVYSGGTKATDIGIVSFSTAGNSWIVHNAWKKGFRAWRNQVNELKRGLGADVEGKWADFKVYLDDSMEDGTILTPVASDGAAYATGEWNHSKLVFDDDGTEREFKMHLIGGSNLTDTNEESAIGLIYEYGISRPRVQTDDPDVFSGMSDSIYAKMLGTDEMSDMMVDNIEGDNDNPPYDYDNYPGASSNADAPVYVRFASVNATQSQVNVPGFIAPCGLLKVESQELALTDASSPDGTYGAGTAPTIQAIITVATGPYRGVLAQKMGQ